MHGLRRVALKAPSRLSALLSVNAGLVTGELSLQSGGFNAEIMLFMAFMTVANYSQSNFELIYAL